jgi:hypothetical protein
MDLFGQPMDEGKPGPQGARPLPPPGARPLAERMRPRTFAEWILELPPSYES